MSYQTAHGQLRRLWGHASEHLCAQCFGPAQQWAYLGGAPDETCDKLHRDHSPYSMDPDFYTPLCVQHHLEMDGTVIGQIHKKLMETDPIYRERDKLRSSKAGAATAERVRNDPEFAERHREIARAGGLASQLKNPKAAEARQEAWRQGIGGKATAARLKVDPEFAEYHREIARRGAAVVLKMRYQCAECDMVTNPGCLKKHQDSKGHSGRLEVVVCP